MPITLLFAGFEFIVLSIGLTFGFYLLITAAKEEKWKKMLGVLFGWTIILHAIIISTMICYKWIEYINLSSISKQTGGACKIVDIKQDKCPFSKE